VGSSVAPTDGPFEAAPAYLRPDAADLRTFRLAGLELPVRSTVVVVATILLVIFDFQRTLIPDELLRYDRNPGEQRLQAFSRLFLYFVVPLAIVVLGFRDRPSRYGLRLGDWRWGLGLALVGCAVMTPIILLLATLPASGVLTPSDEPVPGLLATTSSTCSRPSSSSAASDADARPLLDHRARHRAFSVRSPT
jgi:hypothetical protein